jgi:hypothetical protein
MDGAVFNKKAKCNAHMKETRISTVIHGVIESFLSVEKLFDRELLDVRLSQSRYVYRTEHGADYLMVGIMACFPIPIAHVNIYVRASYWL